jgi:ubiquinone/menaquinone biosynthesis C-methylase UbiE
MEFAKRGINTNLFDTPEAIKIAKKVSKNGFLENIHFVGGDFFSDDVGDGYDLVFISQIFHSYNEKKNLVLLKKCNKAMTTNGRIVIQDFFIDDRRTHPVQSALFAVNMLVNTDGGRCYSPGEIKKWLIKTGFKKIRKKLIAESILISAHK